MEKVAKHRNGLHRRWWSHLMEMFKKFTLLSLSLQSISSIKACFLSRNLLRLHAAGAQHCTAVFQEINLLSSTAHSGSSLLQSGQGPPAMPAMKGAQCTPQTSTPLTWEVGKKQKVSGMPIIPAG